MTASDNKIEALTAQALAGNRRAVSRLITLTENDQAAAYLLAKALFPLTGRAYIIGITGPPGSGKSTLVDRLAKLLRQQEQRVGIIAIDPSSPFSGGAILGDRIRMNDLALDDEVFIRSMGTRGSLGGLSPAVSGAAAIFDACGCQYILIETVGVGQSEVEIAATADTTIVVSVPGLGDDIQMIKAGILEVGDILAVNKADREGAEQLAVMLRNMQQLGGLCKQPGWRPPVILCSALKDQGMAQLLAAVAEHRLSGELNAARQKKKLARMKQEIRDLLKQELYCRIMSKSGVEEELEGLAEEMLARRVNPYTWAENKLHTMIGLDK